MNKIMYEVNWHNIGNKFSHCTITPITIIRKGVLPGCTKSTITAIDSKGKLIQGSIRNYFTSEEKAKKYIIEDLTESLRLFTDEIDTLNEKCRNISNYLENFK